MDKTYFGKSNIIINSPYVSKIYSLNARGGGIVPPPSEGVVFTEDSDYVLTEDDTYVLTE